MFSSQRLIVALTALSACLFLASCGSFQSRSRDDALRELTWSYAPQAIQLSVQADVMLNETEGEPHNLLLIVAQMEDPNAFSAYARESALLTELLLADRAPDGILDIQRFHIEPGATRDIPIDRVQSARYVGVATGYAQLDPKRSARLYQIGVSVDHSGWIFREHAAAPEPLAIQLRLGPVGIHDSLIGPAEPPAPTQPVGGMVEMGGVYPAAPIVP